MYIRGKSQAADYERLSFCAVLRSLDFVWKATKRIYTRKGHDFTVLKILPLTIQIMYQNSSNCVDDGLI